MIADQAQFFHLSRRIGGTEYMCLPAHFLSSKPGLIKTAGRCPRQILTDQRINTEHRKCLLRQQDVAAGTLLHPSQNLQIGLQFCFIYHITWCV